MPNWCEGNLRLRGTQEAIKAFLKNELVVTGYKRGLFDSVSEAMPEYTDEGCEFSVRKPEETKDWLFNSFYIKGTRRNFIDSEIELYLDEEGKETVCIDDVKAAWGFDAAPYLVKAKRYGVDIKIVGFEKGMQVRQTIEIVDGKIVKHEEKEFEDWDWECEMPNMGG